MNQAQVYLILFAIGGAAFLVSVALDRLAAQHTMLSHLMFEVAGLRRLLEEKENQRTL